MLYKQVYSRQSTKRNIVNKVNWNITADPVQLVENDV